MSKGHGSLGSVFEDRQKKSLSKSLFGQTSAYSALSG